MNDTATTFGDLAARLDTGMTLVKRTENDGDEYGLWMGSKSVDTFGRPAGLVYNQTRQAIQWVPLAENSPWEQPQNGTGNLDDRTTDLLNKLGHMAAQWRGAANSRTEVANQYDEFKTSAQEGLVEWFNSLSDTFQSEQGDDFDDLLESIGLERRPKQYKVQVTVTYTFEVEVEASSEEAAEETVDNDLSSYLSDNIDIDYYENVEFSTDEM